MREIVDALPALLHASLLLFFGGMTVFFWSLDIGISVCLLVIAICVTGFYGSTLLLSWWHITCPFYLPWFKHIHATFDRALRLCHIAIDKHRSLLHQLRTATPSHDANVLIWLTAVSPIQEVNGVGLHAIGACVPTSSILSVLLAIRDREFWRIIEDQLSAMFDSGHSEMMLYTLTHKELPTWTALNAEAPLPARAYDYLRTCHAIATLTELHSRAPGLAFVTSRADGTLRMPLLDTVCSRTQSLRIVAHGAGLIFMVKGMMIRDMVLADGLTSLNLQRFLTAVEEGLERQNWNVHAVHVQQVMELLCKTKVSQWEDTPVRLMVGLRLFSWSVIQGRSDQVIKMELFLLIQLCLLVKQQRGDTNPGPLSLLTVQLRVNPGRVVMIHAMELFSHLLMRSSDYGLTQPSVELALRMLRTACERFEAPTLGEKISAPQLAEFVGDPRFLSFEPEKESPAWSVDQLLPLMRVLNWSRTLEPSAPLLSGSGLVNLTTAILQNGPAAVPICCIPELVKLSDLSRASVLAFLTAFYEGTPLWSRLCGDVFRVVEVFETVDRSELPPELQRGLKLAEKFKYPMELELLSITLQIGVLLGRALSKCDDEDRALELGHVLFSVDFISPVLRRVTLENLQSYRPIVCDAPIEDIVGELLINVLGKYAPGRWAMIRDALVETVSDEIRGAANVELMIAQVDHDVQLVSDSE
ncbi:hypothetical protein EXIGLDRAFT_781412 [Exidia glandulosa HHB12029]|uniref:Uncharacterized protein n=1 Tax=Exidia glandulosa HHB12029 TaxID=1314781 RepID=A0A165B9A3_EXIGL|nr:hypothetical protein EXIGLDRAFT_781412 [Exidia glandulosa HHB12029]